MIIRATAAAAASAAAAALRAEVPATYDGGAGGYGGGGGAGHYGGGGGGAGMGGAVFNEAGTVVITNSTFTGNTASGGAGGTGASMAAFRRGAAGQGLGGGLFNHNGTITVTNSTFSGNTAAQGGRGIFILGDSADDITSTITNTIIGQADTNVSDLVVNQFGSGLVKVEGGTNLIRTTTVLNGATNNLTGTLQADPSLGGLASNGGPTQTMSPLADSPAIDQGIKAGAPTTDQRGVARDADNAGTVDIGAVEFNGTAQTITFSPLAGVTYGDADFAISATATSGLPVSFTASGAASVQPVAGVWYVHITGAGSATITAHQTGDANYHPAPDVAQGLTIAKATAVIVVTPYTSAGTTYDGNAHTATITSITGVNGETGATVGTVDAEQHDAHQRRHVRQRLLELHGRRQLQRHRQHDHHRQHRQGHRDGRGHALHQRGQPTTAMRTRRPSRRSPA